jgi:hypothetical protein
MARLLFQVFARDRDALYNMFILFFRSNQCTLKEALTLITIMSHLQSHEEVAMYMQLLGMVCPMTTAANQLKENRITPSKHI